MAYRTDRYVLDEHGEPRPEPDLFVWADWFERTQRDGSRVVKQDYVEGGAGQIGVSTVFLGLDHNWRATGPPVLWESLVFGTSLDGEMQRYTSKAAAIEGHKALVARVAEAWRREHPPA